MHSLVLAACIPFLVLPHGLSAPRLIWLHFLELHSRNPIFLVSLAFGVCWWSWWKTPGCLQLKMLLSPILFSFWDRIFEYAWTDSLLTRSKIPSNANKILQFTLMVIKCWTSVLTVHWSRIVSKIIHRVKSTIKWNSEREEIDIL